MDQLICPSPGPPATEIQAALERILASDEFARSAQLCRFLRYIVENSLPGKDAVLKESIIGVAVFNRGSSYDPKADPIVRVEARRLRSRLDAYYRANWINEAIRISLPTGGYIPTFRTGVPTVGDPEASPEIGASPGPLVPAPAPAPHRGWGVLPLLVLCLVAVGVAGVVLRTRDLDNPASRFWSSLLQAGQPALLIPADSALVMLENLSHRTVSLADYISGEYRTPRAAVGVDQHLVAMFGTRRYTSIADLEFAVRLMHRPEAARWGVVTRYARDVVVGDLKGRNVILLGARQSNPWVGLFEREATFRLDENEATGGLRIVNLAPEAGEPATFDKSPAEMNEEIYGIVTYHQNSDGLGRSLLVAGMTVAGTEAAADFLFDDSRLIPWLRKAESEGRIQDFDILLRAKNLGGAAPRAEVVSFHLTPREKASARKR